MTRYLTLILLTLFSTVALCQQPDNLIVKGKIADTKTGEPLMYVNVGISGTNIGKATNTEGFFELSVPFEHQNAQLFISAVGYEKFTSTISQLKKGDEVNKFNLKSLTYGIEGVEVSSKSLVLYRTISDAAKNIDQNYFNQPFKANILYYSRIQKQGDTISQSRDAEVTLFDATGYQANRTDAYKSQFCEILNVKRNFEPQTLTERKTLIRSLLSFDIVRYTGNILEYEYINDYDLKLISEDDTQWVIAYQLLEPELSRSGDYYAEKMEGTITILKKNYAVLKNETKISAKMQNPAGRSFAKSDKMWHDVNYSFICTYKDNDGKMVPDYITLDKSYKEADQLVTINAGLRFLTISSKVNKKAKRNFTIDQRESDDSLYHRLMVKYPEKLINQ